MSTGYVPLFGSLTTGTLCGRWPDIGLWPIILSLSDRHGVVDVTPDFIARNTGLPLAEVEACMSRFCSPDPYSRTSTESGARLVLLDPARTWGWRIVNHAKYREKARLMSKDAERTESGRDAERKRAQRASGSRTEKVPPFPPASPGFPLSYSDEDPLSEGQPSASPGRRKQATKAQKATRVPQDFNPDTSFALAQIPNLDALAEIAKFRDHEFKTARSDWAAVWRNWIRTAKERGSFARKTSNGGGWQ
jgi:hypothetical protein